MRKLLQEHFETHTNILWMKLSRCNALLISLNISLFFLTVLISRQGY